jgi:3-phytase/alkaline phosphatase D
MSLWRGIALGLLAVLALADGPCPSRSLAPREGSAPFLSLLGAGPLIVPYGARVDSFRVGGLSALARAADGTWLALVDNEDETPARVFRLAFEVSGNGVAPPAGKTPLQMPLAAIPLAGFTGKTLDGEGMALEPGGEMLIASETEPSIRELSPAGKLLRSLPVPELFLRMDRRGTRENLGFESLTLSPGGEALWTANERALRQDAPDGATGASPVRLLRYGRRGGGFVPGGQFVYVVEPIAKPGQGGFQVRGLSELLALPDGDLLALEREYVEGRSMAIQIFRVSLAGATDVSGTESLAGQSYTPVRKTLVFDFARSGFVADNIEGMAFGPRLPDGSPTLVLVSDNNFLLFQQTQIVALRLNL